MSIQGRDLFKSRPKNKVSMPPSADQAAEPGQVEMPVTGFPPAPTLQ